MKELGKETTIEDYEEKIDYIEKIICDLEDLQELYKESKDFEEDYKDTENKLNWLEEKYEELKIEREKLIELESAQNEYDIQAMNYEFEKERL